MYKIDTQKMSRCQKPAVPGFVQLWLTNKLLHIVNILYVLSPKI